MNPFRRRVPLRLQNSTTECAAACLAMVASYHRRSTEVRELRDELGSGRDGATLLDLTRAARAEGFLARGLRLSPDLVAAVPTPSIAYWTDNHYVVVERVTDRGVDLVDPAHGRRRVGRDEFATDFAGVVLQLEPGADFARRRRPPLQFARFLVEFLPRSVAHITTVVVASLLLVGLTLVAPALTQFVVDQVIPTGEVSALRSIAVGFLGVVLGYGLVTLVRSELLLWLQTTIDARMMTRFVGHLLSLPYQYFMVRRGGDLLMRVGSTAYVRDVVSGRLLSLVIDTALIVVYLTAVGVRSVEFLVVLMVLLAVQVAVMAVTAGRAERLAARELVAMGTSQSVLLETVSAVESVKGAGGERAAERRWIAALGDQLDASVQRRRLDNLLEAVLSALRFGTPVVLLLLGATLVVANQLTLGEMLAVSAIAGAALAPVGALGVNLQSLQTVRVHLERLADVFAEAPEQEGERPPARPLVGRITLTGVGFAYGAAGRPAVSGVDLDIAPGSRVAVVGPSGSGKSTLARLVVGLLHPTEGSIEFDGTPIDDVDLTSLRRQCGVVTQATDVLSGSIRSNIALAVPDATRAEIVHAARLAGLHDDVQGMPMGYETVLGEQGVGLSGGQLQRLAIARALVGRPRILVLDEATSHLDAETERHVIGALAELECTQVIIAHRLSTVRDADRIVVLDGGRVVAAGTHEELVDGSDLYAGLVSHQLVRPV